MNEKTIDFSDEIRELQDIKGSLHIIRQAGESAMEYSELFAYQMLIWDAFPRHIEGIKKVVEKLKEYDVSGFEYE